MRQVFLEEERKIETMDGNATLQYYLVKEENLQDSVYGIEVVKSLEDKIEREQTGGISYSEVNVKELVSLIAENTVTPMTLLEIVDDLVTERFCC